MKSLWLDAVGLYYLTQQPNSDNLRSQLIKYLWNVAKDMRIGLFVDRSGASKYLRPVAEILAYSGLFTCCTWRVDDERPICGHVCINFHEAYNALCACCQDDEFIVAECNCGSFSEGASPSIGGQQVVKCIRHVACPAPQRPRCSHQGRAEPPPPTQNP